MYSAPVSLFEKIPELTQILNSGQHLCLILNFECIDSSHGQKADQNLNAIQRHIHWIADLPEVITVILSDGPQRELEAIFENHNLILAPNNGTEIYSSKITWQLPDLSLIRQELTSIFTAVREVLGAALQPEHLSFSQSDLWLKVSAGADAVREAVIEQFKAQAPSRLRLSFKNNQLIVTPYQKWNRGQAVLKILDLIPQPNHQSPVVIYFGVEENDEAAFQIVNKYGLSVIIHSRLPRTTSARYYLRNSAEFSKFLFWIHSR